MARTWDEIAGEGMMGQPQFLMDAAKCREMVVGLTRRLVSVPSPNPPGDTRAVAEEVSRILADAVPGASVTLHGASAEVVNVVAVVKGAGPGRRIVLNGHLDTYPVNESLPWTVEPLGGAMRDRRVWGRGAADMKGGIAASITALSVLAAHAAEWRGEAVLTLAGDEESMGVLGTQWLLENVPEALGDAAIVGDAGSPLVLRCGEKGFIWAELEAEGRPSHGAHVHLGVNAIDRLCAALDDVRGLRGMAFAAPEAVTRTIAAARDVSERLSGAGEAEVLGSVTVNVGWIQGGTSLNLVPASARASLDMRLPMGVSVVAAEAALMEAVGRHEGVSCRVLRRVEPSWTDPGSEIVRVVTRAATEVLGSAPVTNMRVGASDARLLRAAGIPTVVYGPTPFNMGGADENVLIEELEAVARVHALAAFDYLRGRR